MIKSNKFQYMSTNKSQHELTLINMSLTRVNTSLTRVNTTLTPVKTNQRESKTSLDNEKDKNMTKTKNNNLSVV